uniref:Putative transgelin-like protein-3 n=1 Tax=Pinctada fucata TaxID=50426 RepID=A0A194AN89_PINFU
MASTDTRARKSGLGYKVEKKMEDNYDREEQAGTPVHVVNWINGLMQGEHDPIPATDWKSICNHLRDGIMLCKLINKLLATEGKPAKTFQKKSSPFVALANIEAFNKGCEEYGLAREFQFQSGDLWECRKGPFLNVLNCLHSLGFHCNSKKVMPAYTGEIVKYLDD